VLVLLALGYTAWRLNRHAVAILQPVYILRTADVHALLDPPLARRWHAIFGPKNPSPPRLIALTFDDGPYPVTTPLLLDRLHELRVPGTFFLIGDDATRYPELTRRIAEDGNEIGNHTYSHPDLDKIAPAQVIAELEKAKVALTALSGERSPAWLMRPPHGRFTEATVKAAQMAGFDVVLWSDAPGDWHRATAHQLTTHMLASATAPEIAILHSGSLPTIDMLQEVVPLFRAAGYRFVTVSELLRQVGAQGINDRAHIELKTGYQPER
jgi:peptidoglycan/xylan/chitin deacetylase (PgdA/CDA1 family)